MLRCVTLLVLLLRNQHRLSQPETLSLLLSCPRAIVEATAEALVMNVMTNPLRRNLEVPHSHSRADACILCSGAAAGACACQQAARVVGLGSFELVVWEGLAFQLIYTR